MAEQIATDPARVARHSFYPLLTYAIETVKIRKKAGGGVERRDPKTRPIASAAHKDAHIFAYYSAMLSECYEAALAERGLVACVTAFRSLNHQRNIHFADEVFEHIKATGPCAVLATDVSGFFDNLDHAILKQLWSQIIGQPRLPDDHFAVFRAITRYAAVDRDTLFQRLHINPRHPRATVHLRPCSPALYRHVVHGLSHSTFSTAHGVNHFAHLFRGWGARSRASLSPESQFYSRPTKPE